MKTIIFSALLLTAGYAAQAQTGINTQNPQGILHVDGAKDNNLSSAPSVAQQANDFIVTADGNVGIGTVAPATKLAVNGSLSIAATSPNACGCVAGNDSNIPLAASHFSVSNGDYTSNLVLPAGATQGQIMMVSSNATFAVTISTANTALASPITLTTGQAYQFIYAAGTWVLFKNSGTTTPIRTVTTNTSLLATDNGGFVYVNAAVPTTVTLLSDTPPGFHCVVVQQGAGQVNIAGSGVTMTSARGIKTRTQYAAVGIIKQTATAATLTGDATN